MSVSGSYAETSFKGKTSICSEGMTYLQSKGGLPPGIIDDMESMRYWPGGLVLARLRYSKILSEYRLSYLPPNLLSSVSIYPFKTYSKCAIASQQIHLHSLCSILPGYPAAKRWDKVSKLHIIGLPIHKPFFWINKCISFCFFICAFISNILFISFL